MKYTIMFVLFGACFLPAQAQHKTLSDFLSNSCTIPLADFIDFVEIPLEEREDFQIFYHNFIEELRAIPVPEKKSLRQKEIEQEAMNSLEVRHPRWASTLRSLLAQADRNAQTFLVRFAAYEQYRDMYMRAKTSMWVKARGFFNQTKDVVSGWFSSWGRSRIS
jgi:hypothetical protein